MCQSAACYSNTLRSLQECTHDTSPGEPLAELLLLHGCSHAHRVFCTADLTLLGTAKHDHVVTSASCSVLSTTEDTELAQHCQEFALA